MNRVSFAFVVAAALALSAPALAQNTEQEKNKDAGLGLAFGLNFGKPLASQDKNALITQANAARNTKNWDEAEKLYTQLIALEPKTASFFANRAYVRQMKKDLSGTIADNSRAETLYLLAGEPVHNQAIALVNRAIAYNTLGDPLRAMIEALAACQLEDGFARAWSVRADAWYKLGNYTEAQFFLGEAQKRDASITRAYTKEDAVRNAVGRTPIDWKADTSADFAAGKKAVDEKRYADGIVAYTRVVEKKPSMVGSWTNRAIAYESLRQDDKALADYSTAISLYHAFPTDSNARATALLNRANLLRLSLTRDTLSAAQADAELALKLKPDSERAKTMLGVIQANLTLLLKK
nr:hypothetical protein [Armatimonas sp.]